MLYIRYIKEIITLYSALARTGHIKSYRCVVSVREETIKWDSHQFSDFHSGVLIMPLIDGIELGRASPIYRDVSTIFMSTVSM